MYNQLALKDGTHRAMTTRERSDPFLLPDWLKAISKIAGSFNGIWRS